MREELLQLTHGLLHAVRLHVVHGRIGHAVGRFSYQEVYGHLREGPVAHGPAAGYREGHRSRCALAVHVTATAAATIISTTTIVSTTAAAAAIITATTTTTTTIALGLGYELRSAALQRAEVLRDLVHLLLQEVIIRQGHRAGAFLVQLMDIHDGVAGMAGLGLLHELLKFLFPSLEGLLGSANVAETLPIDHGGLNGEILPLHAEAGIGVAGDEEDDRIDTGGGHHAGI